MTTAPTVIVVPLAAITVGDRIREEYGDLDALARSLRAWGQLTPILLDERNVLCDGGRRFRAAQLAGWESIAAVVRAMSDDERRQLELETDTQHKPLSDFERSKYFLRRADEERKKLEKKARHEASLIVSDASRKAKDKPVKEADVADAVGVSAATLRNAKQHVNNVTKFPELADKSRTEANREARKLTLAASPDAAAKQAEHDANFAAKRLRAAYASSIKAGHELLRLAPQSLAPVLDESLWMEFDAYTRDAEEWIAAMQAERTQRFRLVRS